MPRTLRTALTLVVMAGLLVVMTVWGASELTKPFPSLSSLGQQTSVCKRYAEIRLIKRAQVTVSVYNSTNKSGLASQVVHKLQKLKFAGASIGNAAMPIKGHSVVVASSVTGDPAAELVARQFKPVGTVITRQNLQGSGVNVFVGNGFKKVRSNGPSKLRLSTPKRTCVANG